MFLIHGSKKISKGKPKNYFEIKMETQCTKTYGCSKGSSKRLVL